MVAINTNSSIKSDWFTYKGSYGVIKDEYKSQLAQALSSQKQQAKANAGSEKNPNKIELSAQQKKLLTEKYNPSNMSREEYAQLVDELCELGAIPVEGRPYLGGLRLTPLEYAETGAQISAAAPNGVQYALPEGRSNLLDWVRYRASFEEFDPTSQEFRKSPSAVMFAKLQQIMEQIWG